jgi:hypothetical protein
MLTGFMLQMCGFLTINRGDWIGINTLVVLLAVMIAALVYVIGGFLPTERREKVKGAVRYEIIEAFISLIIIIVLIVFAELSCNAGGALVGKSGYTDVFSAADNYIGNLLFTNGMSLMGNIYTISTQYEIIASFFTWLVGVVTQPVVPGVVQLVYGYGGYLFYGKLSLLFTGMYGVMLDTAFGGLFLLFLALEIIEASALTVIAPVAIIMRSLPFMGPQLRRTSNLFLAMAMGFYFVFPLMVLLNSYVASCLSINTGMAQASCSYPLSFSQYLQGYTIPATSTSILSSSNAYPVNSLALPGITGGGWNLPLSFYGPWLGNLGQLFLLIVSPNMALNYGTQVAGYLFLGIVLVALDLGVTAGFIIGLSKGLDSIGNVFGSGPVFGG